MPSGCGRSRRCCCSWRRSRLTLMLLLPGLAVLAPLLAVLAALAAAAGVLVERWLFFAEAEHVSMLYYGRDVA